LVAPKGRTDVPKIVGLVHEGKIDIDDLITHKLPLADINQGFDLMRAGESIRSGRRLLRPMPPERCRQRGG